MNKRQAKKKNKQIEYRRKSAEGRKDLPFFDADIDRNGEGYHDPTASAALRNVLRDEH